MHLNHLKTKSNQAQQDCISRIKNLRDYSENNDESLKLQLEYIRAQLQMIEECLWEEAGQYRVISWG